MRKSGLLIWVGRPFTAGLLLGVLTLALPLLAFGESGEPEQTAQLLPSMQMPIQSEPPAAWDCEQTVRVLEESGQVAELTMAEYLWRVVSAEMPASFEPEALKAQAVCARTYSLWKMAAGKHREEGADLCDDSGCCQAYMTREEAEKRWGDLTEAYSRRIGAAVEDTDGQILTYDGSPIQAAFFSSSTNLTEDAAEVWGNSLPYLVSVDSPEGEEVPNYRSTVVLTAEEVRALARENGLSANLSGDPGGWLRNVSYTASGREAELELGGIALSGGAARSLFGLRSACFTVEEDGGVFTFAVTGYGHGVGMSQYGANAMAKAGGSWEDIVSHYYTGVSIERKG